VDLLVCRNTLMYFDTEAQGRIVARFRMALVEAGYLFLGKAELIPAHIQAFHPVTLRHHIFQKVSTLGLHMDPDRTTQTTQRNQQPQEVPVIWPLAETDVQPGADLIHADDSARYGLPGARRRIRRESAVSPRMLRAVPVDLETLNAALQVTNEELETSNAEFESTNEELGSMNEELHSTNEELGTLNTELHLRTTELSTTNSVMQSILVNLQVGVAVVDHHLTILLWNHGAEALWGFPAKEVRGRSLLHAARGFPAEQQRIAGFMAGTAQREEMTVDASCRGRAFRCHISCTPFLGSGGGRVGAVLVMEEAVK
jgi:two-component system, chemotaxis family, CheB/CheR fusion protein